MFAFKWISCYVSLLHVPSQGGTLNPTLKEFCRDRIYIFVSCIVGVSKAPPVQYISYCTLNGAGVYTHTGAKVLAKINIDQNYLVKSPHSAEVTAGMDFDRRCLPY